MSSLYLDTSRTPSPSEQVALSSKSSLSNDTAPRHRAPNDVMSSENKTSIIEYTQQRQNAEREAEESPATTMSSSAQHLDIMTRYKKLCAIADKKTQEKGDEGDHVQNIPIPRGTADSANTSDPTERLESKEQMNDLSRAVDKKLHIAGTLYDIPLEK